MATVFALRDKWAKGETVFGIFASLPCAFACEVATIKGVDYVCVDQQHGVTDYRDMIEMARAIDARGAVPLTRVPANEDWIIGKNLDAGAQGVIIPMVSNPEQARKAVAACRYPPKGERSNGPARAAIVMGTRDQKALGDGVLCLPMIETREGSGEGRGDRGDARSRRSLYRAERSRDLAGSWARPRSRRTRACRGGRENPQSLPEEQHHPRHPYRLAALRQAIRGKRLPPRHLRRRRKFPTRRGRTRGERAEGLTVAT